MKSKLQNFRQVTESLREKTLIPISSQTFSSAVGKERTTVYLPFSSTYCLQSHKSWRPVTTFTFWLNRKLSGDNPTAFHLTDRAIHALATFLLTIMVREFQKRGLSSSQRAIGLIALSLPLFSLRAYFYSIKSLRTALYDYLASDILQPQQLNFLKTVCPTQRPRLIKQPIIASSSQKLS